MCDVRPVKNKEYILTDKMTDFLSLNRWKAIQSVSLMLISDSPSPTLNIVEHDLALYIKILWLTGSTCQTNLKSVSSLISHADVFWFLNFKEKLMVSFKIRIYVAWVSSGLCTDWLCLTGYLRELLDVGLYCIEFSVLFLILGKMGVLKNNLEIWRPSVTHH